MIRNKEQIIETVDQFKSIIKMVSECAQNIIFEKYTKQRIGLDAYVEQTEKLIKITFKLCKSKTTYIFSRDDSYLSKTTVLNAMSELSRTCKIQKVKEIMGIEPDPTLNPIDHKPNNFRFIIGSAKPFRYNWNKEHKEKIYETTAYEYDLSQAYAQMLKLPLPDLTQCRTETELAENEIGFIQGGTTKTGTQLIMVEQPGLWCQWCFKKMESPYIDLMNKWMKQIAEETNENIKVDLKNKPRFVVGQLQNHNPFWRCVVVERCNKLIKSLMDENTIYSNTDSIISKVERKDIAKLSVFKFKQKHQGSIFRLSKTNKDAYQWDSELPTVSGIQKLYIEHYNKTHATPFILNEMELPQETGHHYTVVETENGIELQINEVGEK